MLADKPVSSRELSRLLKFEHTKINRILGTLYSTGMLNKTTTRKYYPGPGIHILAAQTLKGSPLLPISMDYLKEFHNEGCTVALGVLWKNQVCYLLHSRSGQQIEDGIGTHQLWPAHKSSLGVILLSKTAEYEVFNYIKNNNCTSICTKAKKDNYAMLEFPNGEISIAVSVGNPVIASIGLSSQDLKKKGVKAMVLRLQNAAKEIDNQLSDRYLLEGEKV